MNELDTDGIFIKIFIEKNSDTWKKLDATIRSQFLHKYGRPIADKADYKESLDDVIYGVFNEGWKIEL